MLVELIGEECRTGEDAKEPAGKRAAKARVAERNRTLRCAGHAETLPVIFSYIKKKRNARQSHRSPPRPLGARSRGEVRSAG